MDQDALFQQLVSEGGNIQEEERVMPFGKHKGLPIWGLPDGYLIWLRKVKKEEEDEYSSDWLLDALEAEWKRRFGGKA